VPADEEGVLYDRARQPAEQVGLAQPHAGRVRRRAHALRVARRELRRRLPKAGVGRVRRLRGPGRDKGGQGENKGGGEATK
jgi:hypothetical protein